MGKKQLLKVCFFVIVLFHAFLTFQKNKKTATICTSNDYFAENIDTIHNFLEQRLTLLDAGTNDTRFG